MRTPAAITAALALSLSALPATTNPPTQTAPLGHHQTRRPTATHLTIGLPAQRETLDARIQLALTQPLQARAEHTAKASRSARVKPRVKTAKSSANNRAEKRSSGRGRKTPAKHRSHTGNRVVDFALAQVGKPYIYGADGPRGYDCSGLTSAAWRQAGVRLPHQSRAQARRGQRVPRSAARPGDVVTWNGHVAIYLGGGQVVHAPGQGRRITVAHVWGNPTYRRVG